jgi:hypothetical protein
MNQWRLVLVVSLSLIEYGKAFSANRAGFPSFRLPNPFAESEVEVSMEEKGKLLLESLELESSTEPRAFYTDPKRCVDIATAAMPVRTFSLHVFLIT